MSMQLVVEAAVDPCDPHQREHHRELTESAPGQVSGQVVGSLGDQHDRREVVKELQWADYALARLLAVSARRLPQVAAQPRSTLTASGCAGAGLGWRRRPGRVRGLVPP